MDSVYIPDENGNLIKTQVPTAIGFPTWFAGPEVPEGYLYCDGSEVDREVYKELFTAIGTTWGAGDGVDTFNIPDLRGIFVRGDGGENNAALGVRQQDAIREITGQLWGRYIISAAGDSPDHHLLRAITQPNAFETTNGMTESSGESIRTGSPAGGQQIYFKAGNVVPTAAENRPINVALKPCIRYV